MTEFTSPTLLSKAKNSSIYLNSSLSDSLSSLVELQSPSSNMNDWSVRLDIIVS